MSAERCTDNSCEEMMHWLKQNSSTLDVNAIHAMLDTKSYDNQHAVQGPSKDPMSYQNFDNISDVSAMKYPVIPENVDMFIKENIGPASSSEDVVLSYACSFCNKEYKRKKFLVKHVQTCSANDVRKFGTSRLKRNVNSRYYGNPIPTSRCILSQIQGYSFKMKQFQHQQLQGPPDRNQHQWPGQVQQFPTQSHAVPQTQQLPFQTEQQHLNAPMQQLPASMKQFPATMKQFPAHMKQFPAHMKQFPAHMQQFPAHMQQFPAHMKQVPTSMKQFPSSMQQPPVPMQQSSIPIKQFPYQMPQFPIENQQFPVPKHLSPDQMHLSANEMHLSPAHMQRSPAQVILSPSETTSPVAGRNLPIPVHMVQSSSKFQKVAQVQCSPAQIQPSPDQTQQFPTQTQSSAAQMQQFPTQTQSSPAQIQASYNQIQQFPQVQVPTSSAQAHSFAVQAQASSAHAQPPPAQIREFPTQIPPSPVQVQPHSTEIYSSSSGMERLHAQIQQQLSSQKQQSRVSVEQPINETQFYSSATDVQEQSFFELPPQLDLQDLLN